MKITCRIPAQGQKDLVTEAETLLPLRLCESLWDEQQPQQRWSWFLWMFRTRGSVRRTTAHREETPVRVSASIRPPGTTLWFTSFSACTSRRLGREAHQCCCQLLSRVNSETWRTRKSLWYQLILSCVWMKHSKQKSDKRIYWAQLVWEKREAENNPEDEICRPATIIQMKTKIQRLKSLKTDLKPSVKKPEVCHTAPATGGSNSPFSTPILNPPLPDK